MPNWEAAPGHSSTLIFPMVNFPKFSVAISSIIGVSIRQGAHQVAQKSKSTGVVAFLMKVSKSESLSSLTCGLDIFVVRELESGEARWLYTSIIQTWARKAIKATTNAAMLRMEFESKDPSVFWGFGVTVIAALADIDFGVEGAGFF